MKKLINKTIILSLFVALTGCNDWLDVSPKADMKAEDLFGTEAGFRDALVGVYALMCGTNSYGRDLTYGYLDVLAQYYNSPLKTTSSGYEHNFKNAAEYKYTEKTEESRISSIWSNHFSAVANINQAMLFIDENKGVFTSPEVHDVYKGEFLALRAFLHFDILRLFAPSAAMNNNKGLDALAIPYIDVFTNIAQSQLTVKEVLKKIETDLLAAKQLMKGKEEFKFSDTSDPLYNRKQRMNYYAVTGLLARVCLYASSNDEEGGSARKKAFNYSTEIIKAVDSGIFPFVDKKLVTGSPDDPDRIFSSEVIFALSHASRNQLFKNYFDPTRVPNYVFRMDNDLMNNLIFGGTATGGNQDDYRYRVNWVASGSNRYFYKYADMEDTGKIENTMIPMLRIGEMYLIAAESQSTSLTAGSSYVNTLRRNRGVTTVSSLTQDLLVYEYIRELYGEGQLFYLYKRLYRPVLFSSVSSKNPEASDQIFVVPLPDSETEN